jgi:trehalose 6-phosphate phosphatase
MIYLFSKAGMATIRALRLVNMLYVFDFDGTLSEIVDKPDEAVLTKPTKQLLFSLAKTKKIAIISGRSLADLQQKIGPNDLLLIGNHGLEYPGHTQNGHYIELCQSWKQQLASANLFAHPSITGLEIEDKLYSLSLHYRHCPQKKGIKPALLAMLSGLSPLPRIIHGKYVLNLLPNFGFNKGTALLELRKRGHTKAVFFVGDDETDEDIFKLPDIDIFSVRVGYKKASKAHFYIRTQSEIDRLLKLLLPPEKQQVGY